jgi:hypothetical protein
MSNPKNIIFTPAAIAATSQLGLMPPLNQRNVFGSTDVICGVHVRKADGPLTSPHRNHVQWPSSGGGGRSKPSTADPAPKCNNQPQQPSLVVTNELTMHTVQTEQQSNKEQLVKRGGGSANLVACLCFFSLDSSNQYLAFKLQTITMQQLDCVKY